MFDPEYFDVDSWRVAIRARQRADVPLRHQGDAVPRDIGFPDWIVFSDFLKFPVGPIMYLFLFFMWGVLFKCGVFGLSAYGSFISVWGTFFPDQSFFRLRVWGGYAPPH